MPSFINIIETSSIIGRRWCIRKHLVRILLSICYWSLLLWRLNHIYWVNFKLLLWFLQNLHILVLIYIANPFSITFHIIIIILWWSWNFSYITSNRPVIEHRSFIVFLVLLHSEIMIEYQLNKVVIDSFFRKTLSHDTSFLRLRSLRIL